MRFKPGMAFGQREELGRCSPGRGDAGGRLDVTAGDVREQGEMPFGLVVGDEAKSREPVELRERPNGRGRTPTSEPSNRPHDQDRRDHDQDDKDRPPGLGERRRRGRGQGFRPGDVARQVVGGLKHGRPGE